MPGDAPGAGEPVSLVDWELAARTADRLVRPGPRVGPALAQRTVDLLRSAAATAPPHVAEVTGLVVPVGPGAEVVERGAWVRANTQSFAALLDPLLRSAVAARLEASRARRPGRARRARDDGRIPGAAIARRATGLQVGGLLALLAPRVLGQFDAFGPAEGGRLLLVAPNVLSVADQLDVDLADFALWVALHEEAHRVQFTAAPWLADHLRERIGALSSDLLGTGELSERITSLARALPEAVRSAASARSGDPDAAAPTMVDLVATPEQRRAVAEVSAVMSLLEGHADVAMDAVGPRVVPSLDRIRARFTARRTTPRGLLDQLLRSGLGLEAKLRQYADGARFVRAVTERVGTAGLNAVWAGPASLPAPEEVADPLAWVRRVHG